MPEFPEQINRIAEIRAACRHGEDDLYRARLKRQRLLAEVRRAAQNETIPDRQRDQQAADLRREMRALEARQAAQREAERQAAAWLAALDEQRRQREHLRQNQLAAQHRLEDLRQRLAELRQHDQPPAEQIAALEAELARLEEVLADLAARQQAAGEVIDHQQQQEPEQRARQEEARAAQESLRADLRGVQAQLTDLLRPAFRDRQALDAQQRELEAEAEALARRLAECRRGLGDAIGELYGPEGHPRGPLRHLPDSTPFLLLPVRIETVFEPNPPDGNGPELWVRVYPDEIAVHTHEKLLTDREVLAGELYWTERLGAEHLRGERESRRRDAWRSLVELLGGPRAGWVAGQTRPASWETLAAAGAGQSLLAFLRSLDAGFFPGLLNESMPPAARADLQAALAADDGDTLIRLAEDQGWLDRVNAVLRTAITDFPAHDLTRTDAWTRAPRAHVLPDRFVLLLYADGNAAPREITGRPIPDPLILGPDPLDPAASFSPQDLAQAKPLGFGESYDWMSNFNRAVEQGMGFRVPLSAAELSGGFDRIAVLGVRLSASAAESAALLEELIDNHQYGPKGFRLLAQGTPTNNTEAGGSGYSGDESEDAPTFLPGQGPPAFDPAAADPRQSQADGRRLADALGIAYGPLQTVPGAGSTDGLEAADMNTALVPGTLGYWLKTWMSPVIDAETARQARAFFTRYVSGRGPLPALRVGNQPYGVLLTSDFTRWAYPTRGDLEILLPFAAEELHFLKGLRALLGHLQSIWDTYAANLPFIGQPGSDPSKTLMQILGLQPASAEFYQRVGYSARYLGELDAFIHNKNYANELASLVSSMPGTARNYLHFLGIEAGLKDVAAMRSLHVLWQHYITSLDSPNLIENLPLSESKPLAFDYIRWLATAESAQKIIAQATGGKPSSALLYGLLRNALLLQMHQGAYEWLAGRADFDGPLQQSLLPNTLPQVSSAAPSISRLELLSLNVTAAEPSHPLPGTSVVDWLWSGPPPAEVEAAFLQSQKAALGRLAGLPTARLERLLVEHLDCLNYRLDAWQTGLFAQRLLVQRNAGGDPSARRQGIYLGAFGWVENVRPQVRVRLDAQALPAELRPRDVRPVLEEDDAVPPGLGEGARAGSRQGGFVHAPSLNHASAAALLRNAYLSHASPTEAEVFSVNLSSERVRRGQFLLEGLRNGQSIEALLGYQFERAMHDRTSASAAKKESPVLELNQFIQPYREAFPFEVREITQAGTGPAGEALPAYRVVNGLKLTQAELTAANGYGLAGVLDASRRPGSTQGAAILEAREGLRDSLDAVKDLLMAENAYQLVLGNIDRAAAVSLAQKDAHIPPQLEVVNTPRGSQFTFTNRVTLHFADLDPALPGSNPWPGRPLTPRALAEPGLNAWLGALLGPQPADVRCLVYWVEKPEDTDAAHQDEHPVSLADLGLQSVDIVWLVGSGPDETGGATELETRVAAAYRSAHGISADKIVRITFNPPGVPVSFAQIFPLARHARALLAKSRPLHALDFLPAAGGKASAVPVDKANPKGYDAADLRARVQAAQAALTTLANKLDGPGAPTITLLLRHDPADPADDESFTQPLGQIFDVLGAAKASFNDASAVQVTIQSADARDLRDTLRAVADFGLSDAYAPETDADLAGEAAQRALLARALRVARRLRRAAPASGVLDQAAALLGKITAQTTPDQEVPLLLAAGSLLYGETFALLPRFNYHNEVDLTAADAARPVLLQHALSLLPGLSVEDVVEEWLQGLARVRPALHHWEVLRTLADALNDQQLALLPVQVPYRANDRWLAVTFPDKDPNDPTGKRPFGITRDTLSIAAHGKTAFQPGVRQCGLLVDDWTEEIPTASEITGISFRFNQPNAAPPQALLLAVTPQETGGWDWDDLVGTLTDTLRRAKRRAVEPEMLEKEGSVWNAFAPALVSEFSTRESADVSLDLIGMIEFAQIQDYYASLAKKG